MWDVSEFTDLLKIWKKANIEFLALIALLLALCVVDKLDDPEHSMAFAVVCIPISLVALARVIRNMMLSHDIKMLEELPLILYTREDILTHVDDYGVRKTPIFKWKVELHKDKFNVDIHRRTLYIPDGYYVMEGER